jgi:hypothetical protein
VPKPKTFLRLLAVLAALAVAVPLAACGGDDDSASKDEYKKDAQAIADKLKADVGTAEQNLESREQPKIIAGLNQFRSSLTEATTNLEELEPPEDYKAVHDKLVGALRPVESDVQAVTEAIEAKDQARAQEAARKLQTDVQGLQQAGDEFDKTVGSTD